jgi:hypothetical protein
MLAAPQTLCTTIHPDRGVFLNGLKCSRKLVPDFFGQHHDSSPNKWEKGNDAFPLDLLEETESGSKEGGDQEVSKPALVVVWI